jgi:hypothetical protein
MRQSLHHRRPHWMSVEDYPSCFSEVVEEAPCPVTLGVYACEAVRNLHNVDQCRYLCPRLVLPE